MTVSVEQPAKMLSTIENEKRLVERTNEKPMRTYGGELRLWERCREPAEKHCTSFCRDEGLCQQGYAKVVFPKKIRTGLFQQGVASKLDSAF